jgi:hypothetical protein
VILDAPLRLSLLTAALMIASGALDSLAFTYSASIWESGRIQWPTLLKAGAAFALGIGLYWLGIRYLSQAGVVSPEIQTLIWLTATIVGLTVFSGRFLQWPVLDQIVAVNALASLGWLIARTST